MENAETKQDTLRFAVSFLNLFPAEEAEGTLQIGL